MAVAVVTGSSSGIGRAIAWSLAEDGYSILLHARRNLVGLQNTAELLRAAFGKHCQLRCVTADISCAGSCVALVQAAFAWQGSVQVWVNNAGADVLTGGASRESFESKLAKLLAVDVQGTVRLSRLVARKMAERSRVMPAGTPQAETTLPTLINMSWDQAALGMEGDPGQLFGTAKSAVAAFSHSLALSHGNLRVNCVAPGWIRTAWSESEADDYWSQRAVAEALLNRWGTPADVAATVRWLASPASQFVNGQTIAVNGGRRYFPARDSER